VPERQDIQAYYDIHNMRVFIRDYVSGNKRFYSAVQFAIATIPKSLRRILDVGCGIGYSSWLLKEAFSEARILGIDISERSIEVAQKLFKEPRLTFETRDLISLPPRELFDLVVMLDVYEHIPHQQRPLLYSTLQGLIGDEGWIVITTPTVEHQGFLREKYPHRLQIVDEDVTCDDLLYLAQALSMKVVRFERVAVWNVYDYQHFAACRQKEFRQLPTLRPSGFMRKAARKFRNAFGTNTHQMRRRRVQEVLGFDPFSKE